jgi:hypothetical protein
MVLGWEVASGTSRCFAVIVDDAYCALLLTN